MATIAEAFARALHHHQAGELSQAEQLYRQILQSDPAHAEALHHLGIVAQQCHQHETAASYIEQALRLDPCAPAFYSNLGFVYQALGRKAEAIACYRRAIALRPDYPEAHNNLGQALQQEGKAALAEACCREALRYQPGFVEAHRNLGNALKDQGKFEEAEACYRQAMRLRPAYPEAHANLGSLLHKQGRLSEAEAFYRQALCLQPELADGCGGLADLLREQGKLGEAAACYALAIRFRPEWAQMHNNLGLTLQGQGKLEEALSCYRQALRLHPDYAEAHWNQALVWLLLGDFERGWPEYEWRWRTPVLKPPRYPQPRWDGAPLPGQTILVQAEQGLGDTIQFVRYVRRVKERGARVVVGCRTELVRLLGGCSAIERVLGPGSPLPDFAAYVSLLSLPGIFGTTLATVPAEVPYLIADSALIPRWREAIDSRPGLKIGIAWQGSATNSNDRLRSVPLDYFAELAGLEGIRLFSLQRGLGSEQLPEAGSAWTIHDLGSRFDTFADTAAAIRSLDLVISVDTAVVHCAGALGVPVWVALPFAPDWRWLLDREDSPWYPTMRLFRQTRESDWAEVFRSIDREVKMLASATRGPL